MPQFEVQLKYKELHASGKFGGGSYAASGGLHGVGASVVNALSARLDVEVDRGSSTHAISFRRGVPGLTSVVRDERAVNGAGKTEETFRLRPHVRPRTKRLSERRRRWGWRSPCHVGVTCGRYAFVVQSGACAAPGGAGG